MARLNVEDNIEAQGEFWRLLPLVGGDRDRALGMLIRFFRIAQKRWGHGEAIPQSELDEQGLTVMVDSGWAVPHLDGFRAKGAREQFAWYAQRVCSAQAGGRARSASARDEHGRYSPAVQPNAADDQPGASRSQPDSSPLSLAPSLSLNTTKQKQRIATQEASPPAPAKKSKFSPETNEKMRAFMATYADAFKARYGGSPEALRDPAIVGKIGHWVANVSAQRATELVQVYFQIEDAWLKKRFHGPWEFFRVLNQLSVALDTGQDPNGVNWSEVTK